MKYKKKVNKIRKITKQIHYQVKSFTRNLFYNRLKVNRLEMNNNNESASKKKMNIIVLLSFFHSSIQSKVPF